MSQDGAERRRSPRAPIEFWVQDRTDPAAILRPAANLGWGGLFMYADDLTPGDVRTLEFELPGASRPVLVTGRVAWRQTGSDRTGVGVEFLQLSGADELAIRNWIEDKD